MGGAPRVRAAAPADVPRLVELMGEFYGESGFELPEDAAASAFGGLLEDERLGRIWMAEIDSEAAGFVVLTTGYSMEYGGLRGFVDDLFVRPAFRNRGVAGLLLDRLREESGALGVRALVVEVGPENESARRLYSRIGMVDTGRLLLALPLAAPTHGE